MHPRFLIVDDHPLFLNAIQLAVLAVFPEATVVEATTIDGARKEINNNETFDLVLLDLALPGTTGFEGLLDLRTHYPKLPIVIISALEDPRIIHEAMSYGAAGFIAKSVRSADLQTALKDVLDGSVTLPEGYVPPDLLSDQGANSDLAVRLTSLTPQQLRVLKMLRQGMLNKQIAFELRVGETTVKAHVSEILRKLNVSSRTQAVIEVAKINFGQVIDGPDAAQP